MSIEGELRQMAHEVASRAQNRASGLNREYLEAQKVAADLKAKLDFANLSLDRLAKFKVKIGTDYQCPLVGSIVKPESPFARFRAKAETTFFDASTVMS